MIKIALAQQDFPVGDIAGNLKRVLGAVSQARDIGADLVVFPELAISGYPPEDLLLRPGFMNCCHEAIEELTRQVQGLDVLIGHPWLEGGERYNAASWIRDGAIIGRYFKQELPNYAVFDERRYFSPGDSSLVIDLKGTRAGVIICEDLWEPGPAGQAKAAGAELLIVPNASPYRDNKLAVRLSMFNDRLSDCGLPIVYCNLVGGQDELVFDGRSMLVNSDATFGLRDEPCREELPVALFDPDTGDLRFEDAPGDDSVSESDLLAKENVIASIYSVLVRGLRDYVLKNGFQKVVLGLSGGVDSALTLALAVDALEACNVHAVMMPSRHTSQLSLELARQQAHDLGVDYREISIEPGLEAVLGSLAKSFKDTKPDISEENLQARLRGDLLMALSNKFGWLVLATSNKSELAVGYSTIYGDMCGGFSPLKDCSKTRVYELCEYRNALSPVIPKAVIERPPSAELAPGQLDQDSLPPYEVLDKILFHYVEQDWSIAEIVQAGFEEATVRRIAAMVLRNEYKRRQGAPGVRVTGKAFGRDRRYPITSGWRETRSSDN
jgi:NAD+ synthase (glutamine-hydrolysing)